RSVAGVRVAHQRHHAAVRWADRGEHVAVAEGRHPPVGLGRGARGGAGRVHRPAGQSGGGVHSDRQRRPIRVSSGAGRMSTLPVRHLKTLFLVEWKLFHRIKSNYIYVLLVPLMLLMAMRFVQEQMNLPTHGLQAGPVLITTGVGILLIFSLYSSVTGLYVARREE